MRLPELFLSALLAGEPAAATTLQDAIGNPSILHLSGSFRGRVESIDEQPRPGLKPNEQLYSLRTTLRAELGNGPVHFVAEIFDSRSYGIRAGTAAGTGEVNALEPVQAHITADLGSVLGKHSKLGVTVGRMILNLGSRRLIAADDYRNTTNGYTGLRLDLARPGILATLVYVLPQGRLPDNFESLRGNLPALDRESFDVQLWGGTASFTRLLGPTKVEVSGFHLFERDAPGRPSRDRILTTIDLRLIREPAAGQFDHEIEAAYQWGQARIGLAAALPLQPVAAGFVHADIGYSLAGGWHPRVSAEFDFASGDRPGGKYTRFDTLYGMRRADFSPGAVLNAVGRANIASPGMRLEVVPSPRSDAHLSARALWADSGTDSFSTSSVRDATGHSGRFAGYEFDSRLRYWLVPEHLRAEGNSTVILRRGLWQTAPNAPPGNTTLYISASLLWMF